MYTHRKKVNGLNQRIWHLLHQKKKSVELLATHLNYDVAAVEKQLNAEKTFPFSDLVKICAFLGQLPADFFYERVPEDMAMLHQEMKGDERLVNLRIRETRRQVVRYFERRVVYN